MGIDEINLSMFFVDPHRNLTSRAWWDRPQRGVQQEKYFVNGLLSDDMIGFTCNSKEKNTKSSEANFQAAKVSTRFFLHDVVIWCPKRGSSRTVEETPIVPAQDFNVGNLCIVAELRRHRLHRRHEKFRHLITKSHLHGGFIRRIRSDFGSPCSTQRVDWRTFPTRPWIPSFFLPHTTREKEKSAATVKKARKEGVR